MALLKNSIKLITIGQIMLTTRSNLLVQNRNIKRWVAPTLIELKKRKQKLGPEPIKYKRRSNFFEWNHDAELFAFGKRLKEEFDMNLLREAFINRSYIIKEEIRQKELGIENPEINLKDNYELIKIGDKLIQNYVQAYLEYSLPKVPIVGLTEFYNYLTSDDILSNISSNIGIKDLILSSDFPPEKKTLVDTFKAVIGALYKSSGEERAYTFIRDIICTQLNQKDILEIWSIEKPFEMLSEHCKNQKLGSPEARLVGEAGKNTILATYYAGIYLNKKLIGAGFGENVPNAVDCAALDALKYYFGIKDSMKLFNFNIGIEKVTDKKLILKS